MTNVRHLVLALVLATSAIVACAQDSPAVLSRVYHAPSHSHRVLSGSTTDLDVLDIALLRPAPDTEHGDLFENGETLILVLKGLVRVSTSDSLYKSMSAGSAALIRPGEKFAMENSGSDSAFVYVLKLDPRSDVDPGRAASRHSSFIVCHDDIETQTHALGKRWDHFDQATSITDRFEMHITELNPRRQSHLPHTHRAEEIVVVIEGTVQMEIDGSKYDGRAGDLFFLGSMVPHALTNTGDSPCRYYAFQW